MNKKITLPIGKINLSYQKLLDDGLVPIELEHDLKDNYFKPRMETGLNQFLIRDKYIKKYGFSLLSNSFLDILSDEFRGKKIIEVGSGSGWLAHNLQKKGIDIVATDINVQKNSYGFVEKFTDVLEVDSKEFIKNNNYDCILMSWPDYSTSFAYNILKNMKINKTLIYIGESYGGCTADDNFFDLLEQKAVLNDSLSISLNRHYNQWSGLHDRVFIYNTKKINLTKKL